ncbi:MAG: GNAT family N-acetyltransferase [Armatimonadetes bacterium]|nr:GNAT family N-acetyltransferase [Armatimonadota bacterium]
MIEVVVAPEDRKEELWKLYQEYAHELSQYDGEKRRGGAYHYPCFDWYWSEARCTPFLVLYDHEPIGFCFLQDIGICYRIDEFYIRPIHRRRKFGKHAVDCVKNHCIKHGRHNIIAANVYVNNLTAISFWQSVGFRDTGRRTRIKDLRMIETEADLRQ